MNSLVRVAAGFLALVLAGLEPAAAQADLSRRDSRGPVTVVLTLASPTAAGAPLRVKVALDTHSVGLDDIALDRVMVLRRADGSEARPTAVEGATGGGHHREAVVVFPPVSAGEPIEIAVRGVGGVPERRFVWPPPGPAG